MPTLTLLLYSGDTLIERVIRRLTRSPYSHAALLVPDGSCWEEQADGLEWHTGAAARARVGWAAAHKPLPVTDAGLAAVDRFLERLSGEHAGYNFLQLMGDAIQATTGHGFVLAGPDRYVCSALCATALMLAGYDPPRDPRLMTPGDLAAWQAPLVPGAPPA